MLIIGISAICLALSLSRYNIGILAWFAMSPLLAILIKQQKKKKKSKGFFVGFLFGIFFYSANLYWINYALINFGGMPYFLSIPILFLLVSYLSLYYGFFCWITQSFYNRYRNLYVVPFVWVGLEWIRSFLLTGFPWSLLGYSQHRFIGIIQISEYTGVYGVSFLILLSNMIIAKGLIEPEKKKQVFFEYSTFILLLGSLVMWGNSRIRQWEEQAPKKSIKASVIQGNIKQDMKWNSSRVSEIVNVYDKLTRQAAVDKPDVIIWPETAIPFFYQNSPKAQKWLKDLSEDVKAEIITGAMTFNRKSKSNIQYKNSAILVKHDKIEPIYDKIHLVPFGEYVPLKKVLFFVEKLVAVVGELSPGTKASIQSLNSVSFGTVICFEIVFPDLVRRFADNGARFILNLTNDAWYGDTDAPFQHWAMVVFRCVENRVWVARAANTGISGFINPLGEVIEETKIFSRQIKTMEMGTVNNKKTFYTAYGDIFAKLCFGIFFICVLTLAFRK